MHVLCFVHYYASHVRAGSETFLHELVLPLVEAGHQVSALATAHGDPGTQTQYEGVTVYSIERKNAVEQAIALKPDLIITHHDEQASASQVAARLGVPSVNIIHNYLDVTRLQHLNNHTAWLYNSNYALRTFERYRKPVKFIVNPVVWQRKHRPSSLGDLVTQVNMSRDKGVKTFEHVVGSLPDHKFLGVTGGHGEQIYPAFENVEYIRPTSDMKNDVWARTRVFLFPTRFESWGMAGVEAMAAGIPVIANPTPGILESHRFAPIYVDHRDTDGWVEAVQSLDDPDVWKKYSDRSLKQAGFLDPEPQLELWKELVEGLANAGRNGASAWWKANRATRFGPLLGIQGLG